MIDSSPWHGNGISRRPNRIAFTWWGQYTRAYLRTKLAESRAGVDADSEGAIPRHDRRIIRWRSPSYETHRVTWTDSAAAL
jgi:hypothetical protein